MNRLTTRPASGNEHASRDSRDGTLTIDEAAKSLGIASSDVRRAIEVGALKSAGEGSISRDNVELAKRCRKEHLTIRPAL